MSRLVDGIVLTSYDDEYEDEDDNAKNNEYGGRSGEKVALKSDNVNNDDEEEAGGGGAPITAEELKNKLLLDLAQVHVRLGDNVLSCLDDYDSALRLRLRVLGKYVEKVADVTSDWPRFTLRRRINSRRGRAGSNRSWRAYWEEDRRQGEEGRRRRAEAITTTTTTARRRRSF